MRNTLNLLVLAFVLHTQIQLQCYSSSPTTTLSDIESHGAPMSIELGDCNKVGVVVGGPEKIGEIKNKDEIDEASGLAFSSRNDNLLWIINDADHDPIVFGVHENGDLVVRVTLENAINTDWEAITTAPCEKDSLRMCIYVADIGDACRNRTNISIYKFSEPDIINVKNEAQNITIEKGDWKSFNLKYPHEERYDCESIVIDIITRQLILFTKHKEPPTKCSDAPTYGDSCKVYSAPVDTPEGSTVDLNDEKINVPLRIKSELEFVTDASISIDGNTLILQTERSASIYRKESDLTVLEFITLHQPCVMELVHQKQGEGVSIHPDGKAFYIISDEGGKPIFRYLLK